jgi:hypothetical protein
MGKILISKSLKARRTGDSSKMERISFTAHRHGLDDDLWFLNTGARADVTGVVWKSAWMNSVEEQLFEGCVSGQESGRPSRLVVGISLTAGEHGLKFCCPLGATFRGP